MSKSLYRFLRGELNGFYLNAIQDTMNRYSEDEKEFIAHFHKMQFNPTDMSREDIYNLGKFAGVYLPRLSVGDMYGAFRMTESHIVEGKQRSERGLLERETESFSFLFSEDETQDINNHATQDSKSSLVGDEEVQGYIYSDETDVFQESGIVKPEAIKSVPATNQAYTDFYGNQFTFLSEMLTDTRQIDTALFFPLFKTMQYIRYNGANIKSLVEIISTLCPDGLIKIASIEKHSTLPQFVVKYKYDDSVQIGLKSQRIGTMLYVLAVKFPQFTMVEIN